MVVGGLIALGIFMLAARLLGRKMADGARIFLVPWLVVSIVNFVVGVYWAGEPKTIELLVLAVVFGVPAAAAWYLASWLRNRGPVSGPR
jgi:hypothetical protein